MYLAAIVKFPAYINQIGFGSGRVKLVYGEFVFIILLIKISYCGSKIVKRNFLQLFIFMSGEKKKKNHARISLKNAQLI